MITLRPARVARVTASVCCDPNSVRGETRARTGPFGALRTTITRWTTAISVPGFTLGLAGALRTTATAVPIRGALAALCACSATRPTR